jgi:type IV pilus assembly protein PilV
MSQRKPIVRSASPHACRGVGLIEVMIAVLIMAIGLLGLAGLQAAGIRSNTSSMMRTQSVILAASILDSIRANPSGNYAIAMDSAPPNTSGCVGLATCDVPALAAYDLAVWKCSLGKFNEDSICATTLGIEGLLPDGDGSIEFDAATSQYTVTIQWLDDREDEELREFTMSAQI